MHKKLPLPMIVELNRRLVKGYTHYKDDSRIVGLKKSVNAYNKQLWLLGVRDHQVEYAKFSVAKVVLTLIYRVGKLAVMAVGTLPGLFLFGPVFIASKLISIRKSREAVAASTVKLQGRDVMATWKLLVAMALAPSLYALYTCILTYWTYKNRVQSYIPDWVPLWMVIAFGCTFFPAVTFAALRFGETGMDIFKSLRPLYLSLNPTSGNTLVKLRETRAQLSKEVTDLINTLGPEMFPDFDHARIVADPFASDGALSQQQQDQPRTPKSPGSMSRAMSLGPPPPTSTTSNFTATPPTRQPTGPSIGGGAFSSGHLPRNESLHNLSSIGLFASRPPSRSRSRSGSSGFSVKAFSSISSKESLDEVSKKIRGAMQERGQQRQGRRKSEDQNDSLGGSWSIAGDDVSGRETPESLEEREGRVTEAKKHI